MKNITIILILAFLFSCTTKKTVVQSDIQQKTVQQNAIVDSKSDQTKTIKSEIGHLSDSTQTVTKTTKYDTSKPVEKETGKPPVSEETIITETKIENKVVNTKTETANNTKSEVTDNSKIKSEDKEKSKIVEIPKTPAVKYWFYILITLVIIAISIIIYWKFAKIKTILGLG